MTKISVYKLFILYITDKFTRTTSQTVRFLYCYMFGLIFFSRFPCLTFDSNFVFSFVYLKKMQAKMLLIVRLISFNPVASMF